MLSCELLVLLLFWQGIVASGVMVIAIAWCIEKRGPLFVSAFSPLMLVLVAVAASLTLGEKLYLGRYALFNKSYLICILYSGGSSKNTVKPVPNLYAQLRVNLIKKMLEHY